MLKRYGFRIVFGLMLALMGLSSCSRGVKIAFIVKDLNEVWFQTELEYAKKAADDYGFELLSYPDASFDRTQVYSTEDVMADLVKAKKAGASGVIICAPDVNQGDRIHSFCKSAGMKLMSVDDRFKDPDSWSGFDENIPHMGIDGYRIGRLVGISLGEAMLNREWKASQIGVFELRDDKSPDIMQRIEGASLLLQEVLPFSRKNFIKLQMDVPSVQGAYDSITAAYPARKRRFSRWMVIGQNDDTVVGGVRALNDLGVSPDSILAYGINGGQLAIDEMKGEENGFLGSIKLSANSHGYDTAKNMYRWLAQGKEPQLLSITTGTLLSRGDDLSGEGAQ